MISQRPLKFVLACAAVACVVSLSPAAMAQSQPRAQAQESSFFSRLFPWLQPQPPQRPVQRVAEQTPPARPCAQCKTFVFGLAF
jgi:hypothetical protein